MKNFKKKLSWIIKNNLDLIIGYSVFGIVAFILLPLIQLEWEYIEIRIALASFCFLASLTMAFITASKNIDE